MAPQGTEPDDMTVQIPELEIGGNVADKSVSRGGGSVPVTVIRRAADRNSQKQESEQVAYPVAGSGMIRSGGHEFLLMSKASCDKTVQLSPRCYSLRARLSHFP